MVRSARCAFAVVLVFLGCATTTEGQMAGSSGSLSFDRYVQPILRKRCGNCHNAERPRGELDLTSYAAVMAGGAGGKVVVAGKPDESTLYTLPAHIEEPNMPPNAPKIPQREVDVLRQWVEGGLVESMADQNKKSTLTQTPSTAAGLVNPVVVSRGTPITALAASPSAPLVAMSWQKQILIYDPTANKLLGALAFPEGDVFVLKFTHDGKHLLAAGGVGAESGKAVVFETSRWSRVASLGDEFDIVLAADLSRDFKTLAIGGPSRVVKLLSNPEGKALQTFRKPTDWVTSVSFSPDGLLVAAGDRFGSLFLIETRTGESFLTLRGHTKSVTSFAWSPKDDNLFTGSEDGTVKCWNLHTGKATSTWEAHPGGVSALSIDANGRLASAGRDRHVKVWEHDGKLIKEMGPADDQITRVGWLSDGRSLVSGDASGKLVVWSLTESAMRQVTLPRKAEATRIAMVVPVLAPARPFVPKSVDTTSANKGSAVPTTAGDINSALAAAREAAAASERSLQELTRLVALQKGQAPSATPAQRDRSAALNAARNALASLLSAQAADPENSTLARAIAETRIAIQALESDKPSMSAGGSR